MSPEGLQGSIRPHPDYVVDSHAKEVALTTSRLVSCCEEERGADLLACARLRKFQGLA